MPHALRPRRAHAAGHRPGPARGGGPAGPGPAPRGRRRPLHLPDAGAGPAPRTGRRWPGSCNGDAAGNGRTARSSSSSSSRRPGSSCRSGPARTAPTPCSICSRPSVVASGASFPLQGARTAVPSRSVPIRTRRQLGVDPPETDLEELTRLLIDLHQRGDATRRGAGALRPPRARATPWPSWPPDRTRPPRPLRPT